MSDSTCVFFWDVTIGDVRHTLKVEEHDEAPSGVDVPVTAWEVRRLLPLLPYKNDTVWGVLKCSKHVWEEYLRDAGLSIDDELWLSMQSWSAKHIGQTPPSWVRQEYQITTRGMLALFWGISVRFKSRRGRQQCRQAMLEILRLLQPEGLSSSLLPTCIGEYAKTLCREGAQDDDLCSHVSDILLPCIWDEDDAPHAIVVRCLELLLANRSLCPSVVAVYQETLRNVASKVDVGFAENAIDDPLLADRIVLHGPQKRRRIDESLRAAVMQRVLQTNRAKTPQGFLRATRIASEACGGEWSDKYVQDLRSALHLSCHGCQHLSLAYDAGRFGSPKEETLTIAAIIVEKNVSSWFAPQVPKPANMYHFGWFLVHVPFWVVFGTTCTFLGGFWYMYLFVLFLVQYVLFFPVLVQYVPFHFPWYLCTNSLANFSFFWRYNMYLRIFWKVQHVPFSRGQNNTNLVF